MSDPIDKLLAGRSMHDAGGELAEAGRQMIADAGSGGSSVGQALAGAGAAMAQAGRALAGAGGSGSGGGAAAQVADALPSPRWVLRDGHGMPVKAMMLLPGFAPADPIGSKPACMFLTYLGSRQVSLGYMLATGKLTPGWRVHAGRHWRGRLVAETRPKPVEIAGFQSHEVDAEQRRSVAGFGRCLRVDLYAGESQRVDTAGDRVSELAEIAGLQAAAED